jgi:hypothetical protein
VPAASSQQPAASSQQPVGKEERAGLRPARFDWISFDEDLPHFTLLSNPHAKRASSSTGRWLLGAGIYLILT